jgi:glycosyltransferase involved in cell wall biosynthesis
MKKAHVVYVITRLELGGAQDVTLYTAEHLDRTRFDVTLIVGEDGLLSPRARAIPGMSLVELPDMVREISPVRDLRAFWKIRNSVRKIVRESGLPVIVHTHSSKAGILGRWAGWLAGADVVMHSIHGYGFNRYMNPVKRRALEFVERVTSLVTDAYTADSHANVETGRPLGIFSRARVDVVRSGIDVGHYSGPTGDILRSDLGLPENGPIVTMVSCLKPQKAPLDFVRMAARVVAGIPDANFVQVGDGELREAALSEAAALGISGSYRLLGWRDDIRELIHASDVIVLTSLWEGLPLVIPMAMAAGKPVVATDTDGNPEAVQDGMTGYITPPGDPDAMAEKVISLLEYPDTAAGMGNRARELVGEFDHKHMLERLTVMYEELLESVS